MTCNQNLKNKFELTREESAKTIQEAIEFIQANEGDNARLTALKISQVSGLSRSLLYKEHALKIWNEKLWEKRYGSSSVALSETNNQMTDDLRTEIQTLKKRIDSLESQLVKSKEETEKEKKRKEVYLLDLEEQREINTKLRGEVLRLQQKIVSFEH